MNVKIGFLIVSTLLFIAGNTSAQKSNLKIFSTPDIKYKKRFSSQKATLEYIDKKVDELRKKGFAEANADSSNIVSDTIKSYIHLGEKYTWSSIDFNNIPLELISSFQSKLNKIEGSVFQAKQGQEIGRKIVEHYENNGFPFAKVEFDSIIIKNNKVKESIILLRGPLIHIDSISLKGEAKTNPHIVYRHIGIKKGDLYSEKKIKAIPTVIQNVPYLEMIRPQELYFTQSKNILFLYLKEVKNNRFSGILGFQNDPITNKLMLTGDLSLGLNNVFKQGEWINFNWNQFQNASQKLHLNIGFPYIFKTPIGIEATLDLFKQDTTFIDVKIEGSILFSINQLSRVELSISSRNSTSLSAISSNTAELANISLSNYSIGFTHRNYNYNNNPRKGLGAYAKVTLSNKSLKNQIEGDSVFTDPIQYQAILNVRYFIPTFPKQTIGLFGQVGAIFNEHLFQNEMFRLGGLNTIRGFNEEAIYASQYAIGTFEYRYLYEKNANIRLFTDFGYVKNQEINLNYQFIIGFGVGASIETKAGIFKLDYALGKQENELIQLSDAKVHIGYINNF
jgi:outer membrane protein assembly factor BamA